MNIYSPKQHPSFYQECPYILNDRTPYTYLIGWSRLNMWYYGRRTAKNCHPVELFNLSLSKTKQYHTSSEYVKEFIQQNGLPDVIQIRQIFKSVSRCQLTEIAALKTILKYPNIFLNKSDATGKMNNTNKPMEQKSKELIRKSQKEKAKLGIHHFQSPKFKNEQSLRTSGKNNIHANKYKIISPDNVVYEIEGELHLFCKIHNLSFSVMFKYSTKNEIIPEPNIAKLGNVRLNNQDAYNRRLNTSGWHITKIS